MIAADYDCQDSVGPGIKEVAGPLYNAIDSFTGLWSSPASCTVSAQGFDVVVGNPAVEQGEPFEDAQLSGASTGPRHTGSAESGLDRDEAVSERARSVRRPELRQEVEDTRGGAGSKLANIRGFFPAGKRGGYQLQGSGRHRTCTKLFCERYSLHRHGNARLSWELCYRGLHFLA